MCWEAGLITLLQRLLGGDLPYFFVICLHSMSLLSFCGLFISIFFFSWLFKLSTFSTSPKVLHCAVESRYSNPQYNGFFRKFPSKCPLVYCKNVSPLQISEYCMFQNNLSNFISLTFSEHSKIMNDDFKKLFTAVNIMPSSVAATLVMMRMLTYFSLPALFNCAIALLPSSSSGTCFSS